MDHNGSDIAFARDGTLFISTGDGGGEERVEQVALRAQSVYMLNGKVLHVDRDGRGLPDNPFWNGYQLESLAGVGAGLAKPVSDDAARRA